MDRLNFNLVGLEIKAGGDEATMTFSGYGAVFGNVDSYGDVIAKGAFAKTIGEFKTSGVWPSMLSQHGGWAIGADDMTPVGVWIEIREDDHGLYVEGQLADTVRGKELYTLMKMSPRPAINGMSIGCRPIEWTMRSKPEEPRRTLTKVDLVEISLVTFPANGKARVTGVKSDGQAPSIREMERALREVGCTLSQAKAILAGGYKAMPPREVAGDVKSYSEIVNKHLASIEGAKRSITDGRN